MKKVIIMIPMLICLFIGCTKENSVVFEGKVESLSETSMLVSTEDEVGFDQASVGLGTAKIKGELAIDKKVKITINPEIRESYPVQVTATKIEVIEKTHKE